MPHFEVELHIIIELYENSGNTNWNYEDICISLWKTRIVEPIFKWYAKAYLLVIKIQVI